ncbi:hypothetical protein PSCICJ_41760 [Pseudomonas cichorii]|nr:hypothetical protein PSCICJ_41760 [Pseudomonas cichorii]
MPITSNCVGTFTCYAGHTHIQSFSAKGDTVLSRQLDIFRLNLHRELTVHLGITISLDYYISFVTYTGIMNQHQVIQTSGKLQTL